MADPTDDTPHWAYTASGPNYALTRAEALSARLLVGLLANPHNHTLPFDLLALRACDAADALLNEWRQRARD